MIHTIYGPRKKPYRQMAAPVPSRIIAYYPTSKAIPVCLNGELRDMQAARKEKKEGK